MATTTLKAKQAISSAVKDALEESRMATEDGEVHRHREILMDLVDVLSDLVRDPWIV